MSPSSVLSSLFAACLLALPASALGQRQVIDLLQFQTDDPDAWESLHRQSDSLPFTLEDLEKLSKAGIAERSLLEMARTRHLLAVADADTLVRLKKAGASDALVTAVSAYALPPNRSLDLAIQIAVATPYSVTQAPYLYIEVVNLDTHEQEAFLFADMRRLLANRWKVDVIEDRSDPLLPSRIRSLRLWGHLPIRRPGKLEVRALVSQKGGLVRLTDLAPVDQTRLRTFPVDYPSVSLLRACQLQMELNRDAILRDLFNIERADFRCRWD